MYVHQLTKPESSASLRNKLHYQMNIYFLLIILTLLGFNELHNRIKRGYTHFITDYSRIFRNLHRTETSTKAKEVMYRLLFSITPVAYRRTHKSQQTKCTLCRQNKQETEDHIFFHCNTISLALKSLQQTIFGNATNKVNMYKAIMLNTIPHTNKNSYKTNLTLLAEFRYLIWICRNKAKHEQQRYNAGIFKHIYNQKTAHITQRAADSNTLSE
uniref:Reverse transcriptase zinc-binding domain-containing protein n=1 Tax=Arion vulgaris TaxID=1028688 RepID=A0A0B7BI29_9EUPU